MNHSELLENHLYRSDPIANYLIRKLKLSTLGACLWSIVITSGITLFTALISHTLLTEHGNIGLFNDWRTWIELLLIQPLILGYYLWSIVAIKNVIESLKISISINIDLFDLTNVSTNFFYGKWRKFLALIISIFYGISVFYMYRDIENSWASSGILPRITYAIGTLIYIYISCMLVLNLISNMLVLNHVFKKQDLNLIPLHPDRCGGLRSLGDYSVKTAYLISLFGLYIGIFMPNIFKQGGEQYIWYIFITLFLYMIFSFGCFFGPLFTAHKGMKTAKENLLLDISKQFQEDYLIAQTSLSDDSEALKHKVEKIKELRVFYAMTDDFPVWPFDIHTLRRYLLAVPTPLVAPLISLFSKSIVTFFKNFILN
jgi:hypothetical protein